MSVAQVQIMEALGGGLELEERELIERAQHDREAFGTLYRRFYPALATHIYRRTGDVHATEDLVAEVFLTVLRVLPRYRYRGVPLRFWLLRIATNVVNRWARRQRRGASTMQEARQAECPDPAAPHTGEIDVEHAQRALAALKPKHQAVLSLHYLEGLAIREVAVVLGCREGTVKSRLARARDALRDRLQERR